MAKVSILLVTFNHQKYINKSIQSVLDQSLQDFELIVCDDGSDYDVNKTIKNFNDKRIKLVKTNQLGPSVALNEGLSISKGEYIALFSGDDICLQNRLEHQLIKAQQSYGIHFSKPKLIGPYDEPLPSYIIPAFKWDTRTNPPKLLRDLYDYGNCFCASTAFAPKAIFDEVGLFNPLLIQLQDFDYWLRALAKGYFLFTSRESSLLYRWNHDDVENENNFYNLSSCRNQKRISNELSYIYENFFSNLSDEKFFLSFGDQFKFYMKDKKLERLLNEINCFFYHKNPVVKNLAYRKISSIIENNINKDQDNFCSLLLKSCFEIANKV